MLMMIIYGVFNIKIKYILAPSLTREGHINKRIIQRQKTFTDNNHKLIIR